MTENDIMINRMISELSECREDQRSSENRVLQVIGVAAAIMGALFAISGSNSSAVYSLIADMTFLGTFTYVTTIGFECAFRYHYIHDIENMLRVYYETDDVKNNEEYRFLNWVEVIAPITTKNILHLKHGFTVFYFLAFTVSMLSAMMFGICITYSIFLQVKQDEIARIGFYSLVAVGSILVFVFLIGAVFSGKIYTYSKYRAKEECLKKQTLRKKKENENRQL